MERYTIRDFLGAGGFGEVFKAIRNADQQKVALKIINLPEMLLSPKVARELFFLNSLKHENIIRSNFYWVGQGRVLIDMELMDLDLKTYLAASNVIRPPPEIKNVMKQLLQGLCFMHSYRIAHRDLKPANVLLEPESGRVKIADFGLAKLIVPNEENSAGLGTMYYRSPEVLMGDKMYNTKVDMWATGCIFAELLTNQAFFHYESSFDVLMDIFRIFGTPDQERWVLVSTLPGYINEYKVDGSGIETLVPEVEGVALDLLSRLLCLYPDERISALDALEHPYFSD